MIGRTPVLSSILAAVLMIGVLLAWPHGIWAVSVLQVGLYSLALAVAALAWARPSRLPACAPPSRLYIPLVLVALWAPLQLVLHTTVYGFATWLSALYWFTDLVAFALAALLLQRSRI